MFSNEVKTITSRDRDKNMNILLYITNHMDLSVVTIADTVYFMLGFFALCKRQKYFSGSIVLILSREKNG